MRPAVRDDYCDIPAAPLFNILPDPYRTRIRVFRQRHEAAGRGIGTVNAGVGQQGAVCHAEQEVRDPANHSIALAEHNFCSAGIHVIPPAKLFSLQGWRDRGKVNNPPLSGRNHRLGKHDDIAVVDAAACRTPCSGNDPFRDIIARRDQPGCQPEDGK
jgi:hypothetical protein